MQQNYRTRKIREGTPEYSEDLVDAHEFGLGGRNHYAHARNPPYWHAAPGAIDRLLVRESVGRRLEAANVRLGQAGLALHLFDAWRPREVQAYFHDVWTPAALRRRHPDWSEAEIRAEAGRYWAAPMTDPSAPAPHETGGAVDLTLVWADGAPLFMGTLFDDVAEAAHTDWFERLGNEATYTAEEARANRRLLYWVMIEAGFCNFKNEWWHYSYGDQMWAARTGADAALYGLASP